SPIPRPSNQGSAISATASAIAATSPVGVSSSSSTATSPGAPPPPHAEDVAGGSLRVGPIYVAGRQATHHFRFSASHSLIDVQPLVLLLERQHLLEQDALAPAVFPQQLVAVAEAPDGVGDAEQLAVGHRHEPAAVLGDQRVALRLEPLDLQREAAADADELVGRRAVDGELLAGRDRDV